MAAPYPGAVWCPGCGSWDCERHRPIPDSAECEECERLRDREVHAKTVISRILGALPPRLGSVAVDEALEMATEWLKGTK